MADQEFLASFGVEMDETGLLRLQEALLSEVSIPTLTTPSGTVPGGVPFSLDTTKANRI